MRDIGTGSSDSGSVSPSLAMKSLFQVNFWLDKARRKVADLRSFDSNSDIRCSGVRPCSLMISSLHLFTWLSKFATSRCNRSSSCFLFSTSGSGPWFLPVTISSSTALSSTAASEGPLSGSGAFGRRGDCFTASFARGGLLLGDEKRIPRRSSSLPCDGVRGRSASSSSAPPVAFPALLLLSTLRARGVVICALAISWVCSSRDASWRSSSGNSVPPRTYARACFPRVLGSPLLVAPESSPPTDFGRSRLG